jgi:hypothetical protein
VTAAPLKPFTHIVVVLAMGLIAPFTGLAWPFGALVRIVIGARHRERLGL